ncbi:hypothetical protein C8Q75DRAFT_730015 [Abortiporus biennis]|nr:hypothetical protein C8Q75DRAFT_730015 [Abortiporus biennis]
MTGYRPMKRIHAARGDKSRTHMVLLQNGRRRLKYHVSNALVHVTNRPDAKMVWTKECFGKTIMVIFHVAISNWPQRFRFWNPSKMSLATVNELTRLWRDGIIRFRRLSKEEVDTVHQDWPDYFDRGQPKGRKTRSDAGRPRHVHSAPARTHGKARLDCIFCPDIVEEGEDEVEEFPVEEVAPADDASDIDDIESW